MDNVPDLSSKRAPHRDNTATFRQKIITGHMFQSELDTKTYWLTVGRNMTLTLTLIIFSISTVILIYHRLKAIDLNKYGILPLRCGIQVT
jgi:hypothetical protein